MKNFLYCGLMALASPAFGQIDVQFVEGAPTDRFSLTHAGDCALGAATIALRLDGSQAGLIFDTTAAGAGVEVFQPLVFVAGADLVTSQPDVRDGDKSLDIQLGGLAPGQTIAFTIDVDDTVSTRQITVSGAEIAGAQVMITAGGTTTSATFDSRARATLTLPPCAS